MDRRRRVGFIMKEVFKDLGITLKGEKSEFHFLSNDDLRDLSAFFESKYIPEGGTLWKEEDPRSIALLERNEV
jgi:hypothetical protein